MPFKENVYGLTMHNRQRFSSDELKKEEKKKKKTVHKGYQLPLAE